MADLGAALFIDVGGLRIRYVRGADGGRRTPVFLLSPFPDSLYSTGSPKDIIFASSTASFEPIDGANYASTVLEKGPKTRPPPPC
jgi:hypothetical protein